jgi:hypothetical protein
MRAPGLGVGWNTALQATLPLPGGMVTLLPALFFR